MVEVTIVNSTDGVVVYVNEVVRPREVNVALEVDETTKALIPSKLNSKSMYSETQNCWLVAGSCLISSFGYTTILPVIVPASQLIPFVVMV